MEGPASLLGMFLAALVAATPVPLPSEPVFLALLAAALQPVWLVVAVASAGNVLGSVVTYALGQGVGSLALTRADPAKRARAEAWFARWGSWSLLLSWAPLGDVLCALAGALKVPLWRFLALVALAKTGRYLALAGAMRYLWP